MDGQRVIDLIGEDKFYRLMDCKGSRARRLVFWQERLIENINENFDETFELSVDGLNELIRRIVPVKKKILTLQEIIETSKVKLPKHLSEIISSTEKEYYYFNDFPDYDPNFEGRPWRICNLENLQEEIRVRGAGKEPFYHCLGLFISLHFEFTGQRKVKSNKGNLDRKRVEEGFVFGEDNGDYLYLDKADNYSVWIFYHDGCDVKKVASDFESWMKSVKVSK